VPPVLKITFKNRTTVFTKVLSVSFPILVFYFVIINCIRLF